jgi:hypothetical protein
LKTVFGLCIGNQFDNTTLAKREEKKTLEKGGERSENNKTKLMYLKKKEYNDQKNPNSH